MERWTAFPMRWDPFFKSKRHVRFDHDERFLRRSAPLPPPGRCGVSDT